MSDEPKITDSSSKIKKTLEKHFQRRQIQSLRESQKIGEKTSGLSSGHIRGDEKYGYTSLFKPFYKDEPSSQLEWLNEYMGGGIL